MNGTSDGENGPGKDKCANHTSPRLGVRKQVAKPEKLILSPQPPRVMSVKERKRLLQSRRKQHSQQHGTADPLQVPKVSGKRRRSGAPMPELNDTVGSFLTSTSSARVLSQTQVQQSQSHSSQSTQYFSGNSQSQTSGSLFANLGASRSACSNEESKKESGSFVPAVAASESGVRRKLGSFVATNAEVNNMVATKAAFNSEINDAVFKSPKPNSSMEIQKTPSSLFGEIMKRTQWEVSKDDVVESSMACALPMNAGSDRKYENIISAIDLEGHQSFSALHPPPVFRRSSLDGTGSTDRNDNGSKFAENGNKDIQIPAAKQFRLSSLMPSLAPRRTNIFKQWSKSSTSTKAVEPERNSAALFAGSPPRKPRPQSYTSPLKWKFQKTDYGTPVRLKQGHSVVWDSNATPTRKGPLFRRSPKTPDADKYKNHKTPPRSKHVNWDPKTPDTHKKLSMTPNSGKRYYNSPGGFALQRVLDGCMSPHLLYNQVVDGDEKKSEELLDDKDGSRSSIASLTRDVDDWKECWLRLPSFVGKELIGITEENTDDVSMLVRGEVGFVDWSIKCNARIECNPGSCIPGKSLGKGEPSNLSFSTVSSQSKIEEMAFSIFMDPDKTVQSFNARNAIEMQNLVLAQWKAALMYWQYPSAHPLPPSLFTRQTKGPIVPGTSLTRSNSIEPFSGSKSQLSSREGLKRQQSLPVKIDVNKISSESVFGNQPPEIMATSVVGKEARLRQSHARRSIGALGGLGESYHDSKQTSTTKIMLKERKDGWQECFRGLFEKWLSQIYEFNSNTSEIASGIEPSSPSRCCFYTLSPGRTVLFRPAISTMHDARPSLEPLIVISSSTKTMRASIRSMDIELKILNPNDHEFGNQYHEATEVVVDDWMRSDEINNNVATEQVDQELEALRRATARGESVGAEVSISMLQKRKPKGSKSKSSFSFPPLIIQGHDDCMAFYELYLNTCGSLIPNTNDTDTSDVPLLLSRFLGPSKNMALRCLGTSVIKGSQQQGSKASQQDQLSSVDLSGPILPCAVKDITCALAAYFSLHKKLFYSSPGLPLNNQNDERSAVDENILGSHYFMMHLVDHSGKEAKIDTKRNLGSTEATLGSSGSFCFNGIVDQIHPSYEIDTLVEESRNGDVTSMAVWDVNRPYSIAYKSGKVDEALLEGCS